MVELYTYGGIIYLWWNYIPMVKLYTYGGILFSISRGRTCGISATSGK
jgi:hypothetical protein